MLEAALRLVTQTGAQSMSFQDLADAVRIRKASVHYHFRTKSDLLFELVNGYVVTLKRESNHILDEPWSGDNKLRMLLDGFTQSVDARHGRRVSLSAMLSAEVVNLEPKVADRLASFFQNQAGALTTILAEGRQDGSLRFGGPAEPLAWMILSLVEGAMLVARVTGGGELFVEMQRALERLLVVPFSERTPTGSRPVATTGPVEDVAPVAPTAAGAEMQKSVVGLPTSRQAHSSL